MRDSRFVNKGIISGTVRAFPSKSFIQRALLLGLLNENSVQIKNYRDCGDTKAVMDSVIKLGALAKISGSSVKITGPGKFNKAEINCIESGLCLRMLAPVLALSDEEFIIKGSDSLMNRGNRHICGILSNMNVKCRLEKGYLSVRGPIKCGEILIENPSGSQLITGLLFALSKTDGVSLIKLLNPVSFPYIRMTAEILNMFGAEIEFNGEKEISIRGGISFIKGKIDIEGDWSGASFFLVGGAIAGDITVQNLNHDSLQPDKEILKYLSEAGADIESGKNYIRVRKSILKGFSADIKDHPDLFIPLVVLGMNCEGITKIFNFQRLKDKESDRPAAILSEFRKAGAKMEIINDHIEVQKSSLSECELDPQNDHRLAMGYAIAALKSQKGLSIKNYGCVSKSYPSFFEDLESIRIRE